MADEKIAPRLFRVTTDRKLRVPAPIGELSPGANHFESDSTSGELFDRLAVLQAAGTVKVELLDSEGHTTSWEPPAK